MPWLDGSANTAKAAYQRLELQKEGAWKSLAEKKLYALLPNTYNQKTAVGLAAAQKAEPDQLTTASCKFIQVKGGWAC